MYLLIPLLNSAMCWSFNPLQFNSRLIGLLQKKMHHFFYNVWLKVNWKDERKGKTHTQKDKTDTHTQRQTRAQRQLQHEVRDRWKKIHLYDMQATIHQKTYIFTVSISGNIFYACPKKSNVKKRHFRQECQNWYVCN